LLGLVAALALYAALSARVPDVVASVAISRPPFSLVLVGVSAMLLWFAAWAQLRAYARTGLPTHGALVLAYFLLAEAQILMVVTLLWLLNWWEYHVLMLLAVAIAMGALFIELDRRRGLERFVSAEVVERLVAGGSRLAGEKRVLSILFADLRGSTALGATLPVDAVVEVINAHMSTLARCVLSQGGMVDKYIGDGLLAYFGTRGDASDGTFAAAQAALDMRAAMHALSRDRAAVGAPSLEFGVGIHTGEVILGAIGLSERGDFTVLGDTVNTASRIEGLCKDFNVDIVLSEDCAQRLPEGTFRLRPLGTATVRGKTESIEVFTLE
jgi:adenylate cyclase